MNKYYAILLEKQPDVHAIGDGIDYNGKVHFFTLPKEEEYDSGLRGHILDTGYSVDKETLEVKPWGAPKPWNDDWNNFQNGKDVKLFE